MATVEQAYEATNLATTSEGSPTRQEVVYIVHKAEDETAAIVAVAAVAPKEDKELGLDRGEIEIDERIGPTSWRVRVSYVPGSTEDEDEVDAEDPNSYTFDTGSGTMHRSVAISHIGDYAPEDGVALDFGGAIGVDGDGNVGGVDVVMPQPGFTETVTIPKKHFRASYKRRLIRLTGKVNAKKFRGFAPGEVRFDGASAQRDAGGDTRVTFRFSVSENVERLVSGDIVIEGTADKPAKAGWDYIWFSYVDEEQKGRGGAVVAVVRKPACAHIECVYERGDFAELDIPKED